MSFGPVRPPSNTPEITPSEAKEEVLDLRDTIDRIKPRPEFTVADVLNETREHVALLRQRIRYLEGKCDQLSRSVDALSTTDHKHTSAIDKLVDLGNRTDARSVGAGYLALLAIVIVVIAVVVIS